MGATSGAILLDRPQSRGYREGRLWPTHFHRSRDGTETRTTLIDDSFPIRSVTHGFKANGDLELRRLALSLQAGTDSEVWIPLWLHETALTGSSGAGTAVLNLDTTLGDWFADSAHSLLLVTAATPTVYLDGVNYERGVILSKTSSTVTLTANLTASWASGDVVVPLIKARIDGRANLSSVSDRRASGSIRFSEVVS